MDLVRQAYGVLARQYIELFGSSTGVHRNDLELITRHLSIRSGRVLDVGCGPGHLTEHLRACGVDATGIDVVPEFIEHARATFPDGRYEVGSMLQLPAADVSLAGVLAWYSLIHLSPDDLDVVLTELRRVMSPGATLVIGFFDGDELERFDHAVVTAYYWPADELSARLRRAGLTEIERQRRPGIPESGRRAHGAVVAIAN
jgi:ubiquinone/menaquinone biosynthesis C-methylase UbiE